MAEVTQNNSPRIAGGKIRAKKLSVKIDMTPMVDLAFLLLTFFILTTTFKADMIMQVDMPDDSDGSPKPLIKADRVLNIVLAEKNEIYWWIGTDAAQKTSFAKDGVRKILLDKNQSVPGLIVLIKPKDGSKYENLVDILDETDITNLKRFAIVNFSKDDAAQLANY